MTSGTLSHDEFFSRLAVLLEEPRKKNHGSIHLTQKRLSYEIKSDPDFAAKSKEDPLWDLHLTKPLPILIRATNGKPREQRTKARGEPKIKISTVVQPDEIEGFFARYADICKAGMTGLKKRDRTRRKKDKAKKRKTITTAGGKAEKKA